MVHFSPVFLPPSQCQYQPNPMMSFCCTTCVHHNGKRQPPHLPNQVQDFCEKLNGGI